MAATPPACFLGPCITHESSCTTPSALGNPPYPTLESSGSSSTMFTPATTASRTSEPLVIIENAFSTAVCVPPFLYRLPLPDEITTGFTAERLRIVGASARRPAGSDAPRPAVAPVMTNFLRLIIRIWIEAEAKLRNEQPKRIAYRLTNFAPSTQPTDDFKISHSPGARSPRRA